MIGVYERIVYEGASIVLTLAVVFAMLYLLIRSGLGYPSMKRTLNALKGSKTIK